MIDPIWATLLALLALIVGWLIGHWGPGTKDDTVLIRRYEQKVHEAWQAGFQTRRSIDDVDRQ